MKSFAELADLRMEMVDGPHIDQIRADRWLQETHAELSNMALALALMALGRDEQTDREIQYFIQVEETFQHLITSPTDTI